MVARALVLVLLVAAVVGIGACFSLSFSNGSIACSDDPTRPCPNGYSCVGGRCFVTALLSDGGAD